MLIKSVPGLISLLFVFQISITAQDSPPNNEEAYQIHIFPATSSISIDGELSEADWVKLAMATDFWQQQPLDGIPASKRTDVWLTYNADFLFIAAKCYDRAPYTISTLKRDNFDTSDEFAVLLDPNGQKANGFAFGVNAMNAQTEVLLSAPANSDATWDHRWTSATQQNDSFFTVEMAIPFKTLRYKDDNSRWGIQFLRTDPGTNERHVWAPVPRQFVWIDLGYFGSLIWDTPPGRQGNNIALIPYVTTSLRKQSPSSPTDLVADIGGDAKIALSTSLNLDLTTNPDFSQVEVDEQVTNLTRFGIFFPERRQFFIENSDVFTSLSTNFGAEQPFYSRRIGLDESGRAVPILYGIRLTGNLNQQLRIGAFNIHSQDNESKQGQNYSAATFQQRIGSRSFVKGLFLNRQGFLKTDQLTGDYGRNLGGEVEHLTDDGQWRFRMGGLTSFKEGYTGKNNHLYGHAAYSAQRLRSTLEIQHMGENYFSDMGFTGRLEQYDPVANEIVRVGFTQISNITDYYTYPKKSKNLDFHWSGLENFVYLDTDGSINEWYTRLRHFFFFKNTSTLRFRLNNNYIDLLYPFNITEVPLPAKAYNMIEFNTQYNTDSRKDIWLFLYATYGEFFEGTKLTALGELYFRRQPWGNLMIGLEQNNIWMPEPYGNLDLVLANARIEINFTTNLFWTTFLQYHTQSNNFNFNSRVQWRFAPMSDLYLVYTDNYRVEPLFGPKDKTLVLKLNYWLSL